MKFLLLNANIYRYVYIFKKIKTFFSTFMKLLENGKLVLENNILQIEGGGR